MQYTGTSAQNAELVQTLIHFLSNSNFHEIFYNLNLHKAFGSFENTQATVV